MINVAYCIGGLPFGGIERWLYDLCLEWRANSLVRPRVFNVSGTGTLMPLYQEAGIEMVCAGNSTRDLASHRLDTAFRLRAQLREFSPDIIHTVHFSANYMGRIAALGLGIPLIVHLRNIKREKKPGRRLADRLLSHATTRYLAVSQAVAEVVQADHNRASRPVQVLYNALDPSRLDLPPADLGALFGLTAPVVAAVGRYVPQKNYDLLIRAMALLRDQGSPVALMLVGEGSERPRLEALRDELGLSDRVVLTGFRNDVPSLVRSADIFAMPSDFEGFPIAQLEAMFLGKPSVVSRHVPMLELASEACLVCKRTPEDIAAKIATLLHDKACYASLAENARRIASGQTMDAYARNLYGIYQDVLNQPA